MSNSTKELSLSFKKLKFISQDQFKEYKDLQKLMLNENEIALIDSRAFQGLVCLRELYLYKNKLTKIEGELFKGLSKLEKLSLRENEIALIDSRAFQGLVCLRELTLSSNKLTTLSRNLFISLKNPAAILLDFNNFRLDYLSFFNINSFSDPEREKIISNWISVNKLPYLSDLNIFLEQFSGLSFSLFL